MIRPLAQRTLRAPVVILLLTVAACGDKDAVAKVGKTTITRGDVALFRASQRSADAPAALDLVVARALLAEAARKDGLGVDPTVRARIAASERETLAQAYLDRVLASATTEDALRKRYESSRQRLARRRIHVAQVFVRPAGASIEARAEAQSRATRLYAKLVGGADFGALAKEESEDRLSGARGGDLGAVLEGEVDPRFFEAAVAVGAGRFSKPFESGLGFHVVKALEEPVVVVPTFEEARGRLTAELTRERQEQLSAELRERIPIEKHPERLQAGGDTAPTRPGSGG